jgi:hypothetical protein
MDAMTGNSGTSRDPSTHMAGSQVERQQLLDE